MQLSTSQFDLAIVGGGFGGALLALIARRLGRSVVLLERGLHPRFAIGESSTPLANLLLEELSDTYDLPRVRPLSKWGTWQKAYPQIGCGLKRGFSFFHHAFGQSLKAADHEHSEQLLVAASPNDEVADTHWYRPQFDHFLIREAQDAGVCYLDQTVLAPPAFEGNEVSLHGQRLGRTVALRARFLVDGSGPRGYLFRSLKIPELPFESLPVTQGLFSHFSGVRRIEHCGVLPRDEQPPYPVDDAALHHVFDGGWIWVLHFNNGLTSAGVAARDDLAGQLALPSGQAAWQKLLEKLPTVRDQFAAAKVELPFMHTPRLSFRSSRVVGPNWAMLPSAASFIDPLLSTGFTLTLLGVVRLAQAIAQDWERPSFVQRLEAYSGQTTDELLATERLVAALYSSMGDFPRFRALCLLYFAAVSYTEIGRRLKRPGLSSFLLHDHAEFGPRAQACCQLALAQMSNGSLTSTARADLMGRVLEAIAPIDLIGLTDSSRRHWYPVRAEEIQWARQKLGISS